MTKLSVSYFSTKSDEIRDSLGDIRLTYQKCTVLTPTSLVHIRWNTLCCGTSVATVDWYRLKTFCRVLKGDRKMLWREEFVTKRKPTRNDILMLSTFDDVGMSCRDAGATSKV